MAERLREAHWVGKAERSDEHLLAIRTSTYSARAIRRKPRDEQWNLESVKAMLVSPWELRVRTVFDARVRYTAHRTEIHHESNVGPTRCSFGTGLHSSDCRARFEAIRTKVFAEAEVPIRVEAEVANRAVGAVPIDPNVRVSEPVEPAAAAAAGGQPAAMKVKNRSSC